MKREQLIALCFCAMLFAPVEVSEYAVAVNRKAPALLKDFRVRYLYDPAVIDPRYASMVFEINLETRIPIEVLGPMIAWESGWNARKVSAVNTNGSVDMGLMQISSSNLEEFAWRYNDGKAIDPFDPYTNLRVGMRHLAAMYRVTGSWRSAVWAYNAGLKRFRRGVLPGTTAEYLLAVFGEENNGRPEIARKEQL